MRPGSTIQVEEALIQVKDQAQDEKHQTIKCQAREVEVLNTLTHKLGVSNNSLRKPHNENILRGSAFIIHNLKLF